MPKNSVTYNNQSKDYQYHREVVKINFENGKEDDDYFASLKKFIKGKSLSEKDKSNLGPEVAVLLDPKEIANQLFARRILTPHSKDCRRFFPSSNPAEKQAYRLFMRIAFVHEILWDGIINVNKRNQKDLKIEINELRNIIQSFRREDSFAYYHQLEIASTKKWHRAFFLLFLVLALGSQYLGYRTCEDMASRQIILKESIKNLDYQSIASSAYHLLKPDNHSWASDFQWFFASFSVGMVYTLVSGCYSVSNFKLGRNNFFVPPQQPTPLAEQINSLEAQLLVLEQKFNHLQDLENFRNQFLQ